jgi:hypothetical protein
MTSKRLNKSSLLELLETKKYYKPQFIDALDKEVQRGPHDWTRYRDHWC